MHELPTLGPDIRLDVAHGQIYGVWLAKLPALDGLPVLSIGVREDLVVPLLKQPEPDPRVEPFRDGLAALSREGELVGHLASSVTMFWSPFRPLRWQWLVWYVIVWSDGSRERAEEDFPPWSAVEEIASGHLDVELGHHAGRYDLSWLDPDESRRLRATLGIDSGEP